MTIRHLKIFLTVAETGKMSLAAKQLYLTQPTISQPSGSWRNTTIPGSLTVFPNVFTSRRRENA